MIPPPLRAMRSSNGTWRIRLRRTRVQVVGSPHLRWIRRPIGIAQSCRRILDCGKTQRALTEVGG